MEYSIFDIGFDKFLSRQATPLDSPLALEMPSFMQSDFLSSENPGNMGSGEMQENFTMVAGFLQSYNFVAGQSGWQIKANGDVEFNTGNFRSAINIGTGFHVDTSGNVWWGSSTTYAGATIKISSAGSVNFTTGTFSGTISGSTITGSTFQTVASGQRMVIESVNNTLTFYNASNVAVVQTGGGTYIANAIRIISDSDTTGGVSVSSAISGSIGFHYTNDGNVTNNGLVIQMNGTTNNTNPSIQVTRTGAGEGIFLNIDGTGRGILIDLASGSGYGLYISSASSAIAFNLDSSHASAVGIALNMASQTYAMLIDNQVAGGNPTGIKLNVANSSGNGYAFEFAGDIQQSVSVILPGAIPNNKIRVLLPSGVVGYLYCYDG